MLLSKIDQGCIYLKNSHIRFSRSQKYSKKYSHFYLQKVGNLSGNYKWEWQINRTQISKAQNGLKQHYELSSIRIRERGEGQKSQKIDDVFYERFQSSNMSKMAISNSTLLIQLHSAHNASLLILLMSHMLFFILNQLKKASKGMCSIIKRNEALTGLRCFYTRDRPQLTSSHLGGHP